MYVDFKITNWERVLIPNELEKKVLKLLKNKTVESSCDLYNEVNGDLLTLTTIDEVEEQMSVEDNDGCSTIEAYNDEGETLFENGEVKEIKKVLYYTVAFDFQDNGETEEKNGNKTITVYSIVNNKPKIFCEIESFNDLNTENEIQTYLDNNGYEDEEFDFEIL